MFNKLHTDKGIGHALHKQDLGLAAVAVLHYFCFNINKQNIVTGTPETLSKLFNMSLLHINQGIRTLKKVDVIRKYTKQEYMLHPDIAYNGDDKRYWVLKHMWDTQTTSGLRNR